MPGRRAAENNAGPTLPGAYTHALRKHCERLRGPDYRLIEMGPEKWEQHKAAAVAAVAELFNELLAASQPVIADRWDLRTLPGAEAISWLGDVRGPRDVLIYADDAVELIADSETVRTSAGRILRNPIV